ncbi:MAG: hypothetical protein C0176_08835 [Mesoaciditoga sp.]|uniref:hypothetical protein n=1 Tax=Athalassotoga sp. TaxID=2022597 RepID=UPI000CB06D4E|nr:MAG: hypothetical protein C0176_08835 [Mesoaciditoga sp.]HEU23790.1 hypothetical protein [Mesoaciditoga lauensis]
MRVLVYPLTFLIFVSYVFGSSFINTFITSYASQIIQGQRIVIEEGQNSRVRYESVLRDGRNEIIKVMAPMPFEWAMINGDTYIIEGNEMRPSPVPISDVEQKFMELLSSATTTTIISTQNVIYQGEPSIQVNLITPNSTYIAIVSKGSLIIKFMKVQRDKNSISMIYTQIIPVSAGYFQSVLKSFKISKEATPDTVESVVWKIISNLTNANIMSLKLNGVDFTIVSGIISPQNNVVCYLFQMNSKVSPDPLVSQFKSQGYTSMAVKYKDLYIVMATNGNIDTLKAWASKLFSSVK